MSQRIERVLMSPLLLCFLTTVCCIRAMPDLLYYMSYDNDAHGFVCIYITVLYEHVYLVVVPIRCAYVHA